MINIGQPQTKLNENSEPLHPVVQLKLGTRDFIATVPPENLIDFTYTSRQGIDEVSVVFIDPTFGDIEQLLFETEKADAPLVVRWGYPGNGLEECIWRSFDIQAIVPTIAHTGIRLNITGKAVGSDYGALVEPSIYVGKISSVAMQIAQEMGFSKQNIFIEETSDDENEVNAVEWPSAGKTRIDIIYRDLIPQARSKFSDRVEEYIFRLTADKSFHFHTPSWNGISKDVYESGRQASLGKYKQFKFLRGIPTGVQEFTPRYNTGAIATFAKQTISSTYDSRKKRYSKMVLNRDTVNIASDEDNKGAKTSAQPLTKKTDSKSVSESVSSSIVFNQTKGVGYGGRCSGKVKKVSTEVSTAHDKAKILWANMQNALHGASMTLVGLPEFVNLACDDLFYDILVILPPRDETGWTGTKVVDGNLIHWSSGRYHISSVVHTISHNYIINVELFRAYQLEGASDASRGTESEKKTEEVNVT